MNKTCNAIKVRTTQHTDKAKHYEECLDILTDVINNRCKQIYKRLTVNDVEWDKDADLLSYRDKLVGMLTQTGFFSVHEVCCTDQPACDVLVDHADLVCDLCEIEDYIENIIEMLCDVDFTVTSNAIATFLNVDDEIRHCYTTIAYFKNEVSENICMEMGEPMDFDDMHPASFEFRRCYGVGDDIIRALLTHVVINAKNNTYIEILQDEEVIAVVDATDNSIYTDYPIDAFI